MVKNQRIRNDRETDKRRNKEDRDVRNDRERNDALTKKRRSESDMTLKKNRERNDEQTVQRRKTKDGSSWVYITLILVFVAFGVMVYSLYV